MNVNQPAAVRCLPRLSHTQLIIILFLTVFCGCSNSQVETARDSNAAGTSTATSNASILEGQVVGITDGDTLTLLDTENKQHKVRLQGIDAPEKEQAFGNVSRQHLANLVFNKRVTVQYDKLDRYGRTVGKVLVEDRDVGLEQLRAGLAWHYKQYANEQSESDVRLYDSAEREARKRGIGLWKDVTAIPPWEYRQGEREAGSRSSDLTSNNNAESRAKNDEGLIRGNRRSMIYHWPGCPNYDDIAPHNRVLFQSREEAERAGYRAARNCR